MKLRFFLLLGGFLFISISYSQPDITTNSINPVDKDHKLKYFERNARKQADELSSSLNEERARSAENDIRIATQNNRPLSFQEESTLQAIITDFQVNENTGASTAWQWHPSVAIDGSGNYIITWEDYRNGDSDIYAQRYTGDGTALGSNFMVSEDTEGVEQSYPVVIADSLGNFIITWEDMCNGGYDIYAQRYNSNGEAQGPNFQINDDTEGAWQNEPVIGMDKAGNFVIAWQDWRNGDSDIYAQIFTSEGIAQGANLRINEDTGNDTPSSHPALAVDGLGNFIICWQD